MSIIVITLFSSCGFKEKHDAQELYLRVTGINDTLEKMTIDWHDKLDRAVVKKNFFELGPLRTALGSYISDSRNALSKMPATSANEKLRNDEDNLLSNRSAVVADVYPLFEMYSALTPKDVLKKNLLLLVHDLDSSKAHFLTVKNDLKAYADKYQLKTTGK